MLDEEYNVSRKCIFGDYCWSKEKRNIFHSLVLFFCLLISHFTDDGPPRATLPILSSATLPYRLSVITKDLPISPCFSPFGFLSRCKFSTLTTRQKMVEFYLLTFSRFQLRKTEKKQVF